MYIPDLLKVLLAGIKRKVTSKLITNVVKNFKSRQGFAQIPIIIGLAILVAGLAAVGNLSQQNQDTRQWAKEPTEAPTKAPTSKPTKDPKHTCCYLECKSKKCEKTCIETVELCKDFEDQCTSSDECGGGDRPTNTPAPDDKNCTGNDKCVKKGTCNTKVTPGGCTLSSGGTGECCEDKPAGPTVIPPTSSNPKATSTPLPTGEPGETNRCGANNEYRCCSDSDCTARHYNWDFECSSGVCCESCESSKPDPTKTPGSCMSGDCKLGRNSCADWGMENGSPSTCILGYNKGICCVERGGSRPGFSPTPVGGNPCTNNGGGCKPSNYECSKWGDLVSSSYSCNSTTLRCCVPSAPLPTAAPGVCSSRGCKPGECCPANIKGCVQNGAQYDIGLTTKKCCCNGSEQSGVFIFSDCKTYCSGVNISPTPTSNPSTGNCWDDKGGIFRTQCYERSVSLGYNEYCCGGTWVKKSNPFDSCSNVCAGRTCKENKDCGQGMVCRDIGSGLKCYFDGTGSPTPAHLTSTPTPASIAPTIDDCTRWGGSYSMTKGGCSGEYENTITLSSGYCCVARTKKYDCNVVKKQCTESYDGVYFFPDLCEKACKSGGTSTPIPTKVPTSTPTAALRKEDCTRWGGTPVLTKGGCNGEYENIITLSDGSGYCCVARTKKYDCNVVKKQCTESYDGVYFFPDLCEKACKSGGTSTPIPTQGTGGCKTGSTCMPGVCSSYKMGIGDGTCNGGYCCKGQVTPTVTKIPSATPTSSAKDDCGLFDKNKYRCTPVGACTMIEKCIVGFWVPTGDFCDGKPGACSAAGGTCINKCPSQPKTSPTKVPTPVQGEYCEIRSYQFCASDLQCLEKAEGNWICPGTTAKVCCLELKPHLPTFTPHPNKCVHNLECKSKAECEKSCMGGTVEQEAVGKYFCNCGSKPGTTVSPTKPPMPTDKPGVTAIPTVKPKECLPGDKTDITGAQNPGCCCLSTDCPVGQQCNIPNGYCKSGSSCNPNPEGKYRRKCAWDASQGKNICSYQPVGPGASEAHECDTTQQCTDKHGTTPIPTPTGGWLPPPTSIPTGSGGTQPTSVPTGSGGGNQPTGSGRVSPTTGPTGTLACLVCPDVFYCYEGPTVTSASKEYRWFAPGYQWSGWTKVEDTKCNVSSKPTYKGKTFGDANCDGRINTVDFSIWRQESLDKGGRENDNVRWEANFNCPTDKRVNTIDFSIWRNNSYKD